MKTIHIETPIWSKKAVGIAHHRITDDLQVIIDYEDRNHEKVFPNPYFISQDMAGKYPVMIKRVGKRKWIYLHIIPIAAMEVMKN